MHIDWWTLLLQTVNVLILVWILARFFFRPVMAIVVKRQEEAGKVLSDAAATRQQAEAARSEAQQARAGIESERQRLVAEARQEAAAEKARLLADAAQEVGRMRDAAAQAAVRDRAAAQDALMKHAGDLSVDIARRLLTRVASGATLPFFLDGLCAEIRGLPEEARAAFGTPGPGDKVELWSAAALSDEEQQLARRRLAEALGCEPPLDFHHDKDLLAGLELRNAHAVVRNNWRSDLDRIGEELGHERPAGAA
jgi:F-type H+-transporting ATPase subunit b